MAEISSPYSLFCTVCNNHFEKQDWLPHLVDTTHIKLSRIEGTREWTDEIKKCTLVGFSSSPVGSLTVLEHFSVGGNLVTDFVWWNERPRLGLLQFESSKCLDKIIKLVTKSPGKLGSALIEDQPIQFLKATDKSDLEFNAFLPSMSLECTTLYEKIEPVHVPEVIPDVTPEDKMIPVEERTAQRNYELIDHLFFKQLKNSKWALSKSNILFMHQLKRIYNEVEIPCANFKKVRVLLTNLQGRLAQHCPSTKVLMIRHFYLKLKLGRSDCPFLFIAYENSKTNHAFVSLKLHKIAGSLKLHYPKDYQSLPENKMSGFGYQDSCTGLQFRLVTSPLHIEEMQQCRLFKYLCTFNPLAHPLLTIVFYWFKVNTVENAAKAKNSFHAMPPLQTKEQASLEWMVMLFLCQERLVPSPRTVLEGPHQPLLLNDQSSKDIGFSVNPEMVKKWRASFPEMGTKEFTNHLLELTIKFLFFCSSLRCGSHILNVKDGEMLKMDDFLKGRSSGKLSEEETKILQKKFEKSGGLSKRKIYMINPLDITKEFFFCEKMFLKRATNLMTRTARKLRQAFSEEESGKGDLIFKMEDICQDKFKFLSILHLTSGEFGSLKENKKSAE